MDANNKDKETKHNDLERNKNINKNNKIKNKPKIK